MRNILVLTYWSFDDALVQTYTLPYVRMIRKVIRPSDTVTLVTFDRSTVDRSSSACRNLISGLEADGIKCIHFAYSPFGMKAMLIMAFSFLKLYFTCVFTKITHIHAFCTPAGAMALVLARLTGSKLILDSFEPHAEAMVENGTWHKKSFRYRFLFAMEKRMAVNAHAAVACTPAFSQYVREKYGVNMKHLFSKPACVDLEQFSLHKVKNPNLATELHLDGKLVAVYAGKLGGIYLGQEIFDFCTVAYHHWGESFRFLLHKELTVQL